MHTWAWGGKSESSPELGQENLHHSQHVHIHVQWERGLGGSRDFNIVNLQESVSVRHGQSLMGRFSTANITAPYHDATPAGAVESIGGHWGSILVMNVEWGVGALWHIQQEVQHRVEGGSAGT